MKNLLNKPYYMMAIVDVVFITAMAGIFALSWGAKGPTLDTVVLGAIVLGTFLAWHEFKPEIDKRVANDVLYKVGFAVLYLAALIWLYIFGYAVQLYQLSQVLSSVGFTSATVLGIKLAQFIWKSIDILKMERSYPYIVDGSQVEYFDGFTRICGIIHRRDSATFVIEYEQDGKTVYTAPYNILSDLKYCKKAS